ncbi:MAG: hypothetical protein H2184_02285 [Candidatus Galacturonibacter soehngenii]|nr:hypothetical protein [Candidatus Galacturonibacter soehngenii]
MNNIHVNIIGGQDGPTSIFLAGNLGSSWINYSGLIIVICILIPNIIYFIKNSQNKAQSNLVSMNKGITLIEQLGRYMSMFFIVFNVGILEYGFSSFQTLAAYYLGNIILVIAYWIIWIMYFMNKSLLKSMALAIIPTVIFLLSGVTKRKYLLVISAIIFGISHIIITYKSNNESRNV